MVEEGTDRDLVAAIASMVGRSKGEAKVELVEGERGRERGRGRGEGK